MNEYTDLNPIEDIIDKEEENRIFADIAKIEGVHEYFRLLMSRDMKIHFQSQNPKEQDLARGAFFRTEWLSKKIKSNSLDIN